MQPFSKHWPWRVFWLVFGFGLGALMLADHRLSQRLAGCGFIAYGIVWSLVPTRLNVGFRENLKANFAMPPYLRVLSALSAFLLLAGVVLALVSDR